MKWLSYLLLPLGILIGYLIPHPSSAPAPLTDTSSPPPRRNRPEVPSDPARSARILALADRIGKGDRSGEDNSSATVAIADIPAIIERLLSQAGPSGLSWQLQSEIDNMLARWAAEDFDSAFSWAKGYPSANASKDFLEAILEKRAETDFEGTLALVKSLLADDGIRLDLGKELFDTAVKLGAERAFEALIACPSDGYGSSGSTGNFPPGFDFKAFAELSMDFSKNRKGGGSAFSYYPTNVLEEWAKSDTTAALGFYLSSSELTFNDLGDITKSFIDPSEPESAYPWILEQYRNLDAEQRKKFAGDLNSVFPSEMGAAPLLKMVNAIPDPALREQIAKEMFDGFGGSRTGNSMPYLDLLSVLPTPAARLEFLSKSNMRYSISLAPQDKLDSLGITKEQIDALGSE